MALVVGTGDANMVEDGVFQPESQLFGTRSFCSPQTVKLAELFRQYQSFIHVLSWTKTRREKI